VYLLTLPVFSYERKAAAHLSIKKKAPIKALIIAAFLTIALPCRAQSPVTTPAVSRDPSAIQLLTNALNLVGGLQGWQSIHGARVTGNLTVQGMSKTGQATTNTFVWLDDWSTGHSRYNRATTNSAGTTHIMRHGDSPSFAARTPKGETRAARFDPTIVLLTHLPAASLAMILNDTSYSVTKTSHSNDSTHNEVLVSKSDGTMAQIWFVSIATGQIEAVRYTLPDVLNGSHFTWDVAVYKHYRSVSGLSFPDQVTIIRPNSAPVQIEFKSLEANPTVSISDFTLGGGQ